MKHSIDNYRYCLGILTDKGKYVSFTCLHIILGIALPFVVAMIPAMMVNAVSGESIGYVTIMILAAAVLALQCVDQYADETANRILFLSRLNSGKALLKSSISSDPAYLESPEGRVAAENARRAVYEGNDTGLEMYMRQFPQLFLFGMATAVETVLLFRLSPMIAAAAVTAAVFSLLLQNRILRKDRDVQNELAGEYSDMRTLYQPIFDESGRRDIYTYQFQKLFLKKFRKLRIVLRRLQTKSYGVYFWAAAADAFIMILRDVVLLGVLSVMVFRAELSVASFLFFAGILGTFDQWIEEVFFCVQEINRNSVIIDHFRSFLSLEHKKNTETESGAPAAWNKALALKGVSFQYPDSEERILHDIDIAFQKGEKVAVVGLNGAGKTTLMKLILGLYEPTEGTIQMDGADIRSFSKVSYQSMFSAILQDDGLLPASLLENITSKPETALTGGDRARFADVAEEMELSGVLRRLPDGERSFAVNSYIQNETILSGGEEQRVLLARALYKNAEFVILDEPTASMDAVSEEKLYTSFASLMQNRTGLFISHRLSSTRFCDRIILLKDGTVAEQGTHAQLLQKGGEYARLFELQARQYKEEAAYA